MARVNFEAAEAASRSGHALTLEDIFETFPEAGAMLFMQTRCQATCPTPTREFIPRGIVEYAPPKIPRSDWHSSPGIDMAIGDRAIHEILLNDRDGNLVFRIKGA